MTNPDMYNICFLQKRNISSQVLFNKTSHLSGYYMHFIPMKSKAPALPEPELSAKLGVNRRVNVVIDINANERPVQITWNCNCCVSLFSQFTNIVSTRVTYWISHYVKFDGCHIPISMWFDINTFILVWEISIKVELKYVIHYGDVIMATMASQISSLTIVYSTVHSGADQSKINIIYTLDNFIIEIPIMDFVNGLWVLNHFSRCFML